MRKKKDWRRRRKIGEEKRKWPRRSWLRWRRKILLSTNINQQLMRFSGKTLLHQKDKYNLNFRHVSRDGNGAGRVRVSWSHPHPHNKNSSPSPSPNPTGIQLLTHPHPHRVTGIFLYPYPYPFFYCSIYQLNIFYKKNLKITPTESWYYQNIQY